MTHHAATDTDTETRVEKRERNGWRNVVIAILISFLLPTLGLTYAVQSRLNDFVTKNELFALRVEMLQAIRLGIENSPYAMDRGRVNAQFSNIETTLVNVEKAQIEGNKILVSLSIDVAVLKRQNDMENGKVKP